MKVSSCSRFSVIGMQGKPGQIAKFRPTSPVVLKTHSRRHHFKLNIPDHTGIERSEPVPQEPGRSNEGRGDGRHDVGIHGVRCLTT